MVLVAYLTAIIGVMAAQMAPGPNMMAVAALALGQGRRPALAVVVGVASGTLVWAAAVAYGLGRLFEILPASLIVLKFFGGFYLLFIGGKAIVAAARGEAALVSARAAPMTLPKAWRRGFLVVMTNPKAALMWSALATFLFGAHLTSGEVLGFGPLAATTSLLIYGGYGLLFSTPRALRFYARFTRRIEAVFGAAFGALGATLVGAGFASLKP